MPLLDSIAFITNKYDESREIIRYQNSKIFLTYYRFIMLSIIIIYFLKNTLLNYKFNITAETTLLSFTILLDSISLFLIQLSIDKIYQKYDEYHVYTILLYVMCIVNCFHFITCMLLGYVDLSNHDIFALLVTQILIHFIIMCICHICDIAILLMTVIPKIRIEQSMV